MPTQDVSHAHVVLAPHASTRLTLIRHGETAWNQDRRIQGHTDVPLNPQGLAQAQCMAQALADSDIDAIYSSDLARAWQTAQALHQRSHKPLQAHAGLRERHFGRWQGLTLEALRTQAPEQAQAFHARDPHYQPPEGESLLRLQARVLAAIATLAAAHLGGHIAIVSHGGVLDTLYRQATGLPLDAPRTWAIDNTSIHRMLWTPQHLRLLAWGDVGHLQALPTPPRHAASGEQAALVAGQAI